MDGWTDGSNETTQAAVGLISRRTHVGFPRDADTPSHAVGGGSQKGEACSSAQVASVLPLSWSERAYLLLRCPYFCRVLGCSGAWQPRQAKRRNIAKVILQEASSVGGSHTVCVSTDAVMKTWAGKRFSSNNPSREMGAHLSMERSGWVFF